MILFINYTLLRITTHFYSIAITLQRYSEKVIISNRFSKYTWPWNRIVPKKTAVRTCCPVWRHVNIGTIDSGQNICSTIYNNKLEQKFCGSLFLNGGCLSPRRSLTFGRACSRSAELVASYALLLLNRSLPSSVSSGIDYIWFVSFRLTTINGRNGMVSRGIATFAKWITNELQVRNRTT